MLKKNVIEFYDNFLKYQRESKINERIYFLYKQTKKYGIKKSSNILELGSGIGTMTYLLSKYVKKGIIESVDISPKSVEFAKRHIKAKNTKISAGDIVNYKPEINSIDFVTLFDVIEHIPKEKHYDLFNNLSNYINQKTLVLINIPNPEYIEYLQKHKPEILQVIDQPIHLNFLMDNLEKNNLNILHYHKYSIWMKNDYIFYVVEKKKPFKEIRIHDNRSFVGKVLKKLFKIKLKMFYNYC